MQLVRDGQRRRPIKVVNFFYSFRVFWGGEVGRLWPCDGLRERQPPAHTHTRPTQSQCLSRPSQAAPRRRRPSSETLHRLAATLGSRALTLGPWSSASSMSACTATSGARARHRPRPPALSAADNARPWSRGTSASGRQPDARRAQAAQRHRRPAWCAHHHYLLRARIFRRLRLRRRMRFFRHLARIL